MGRNILREAFVSWNGRFADYTSFGGMHVWPPYSAESGYKTLHWRGSPFSGRRPAGRHPESSPSRGDRPLHRASTRGARVGSFACAIQENGRGENAATGCCASHKASSSDSAEGCQLHPTRLRRFTTCGLRSEKNLLSDMSLARPMKESVFPQ